MVLWGVVLLLMGYVRNYHQLLVCRVFLGIFEAGLFPGVNYYLSCWYKRNEFGIRAAIFFSAAAVLPNILY
jgi:MFS family permease